MNLNWRDFGTIVVSSLHSRIAACSIVSKPSTFPPGPFNKEKEKRLRKIKNNSIVFFEIVDDHLIYNKKKT